MPSRRELLRFAGLSVLGLAARRRRAAARAPGAMSEPKPTSEEGPDPVTLFLAGDVMTGRGIDQILARPSEPRLHEPWVESALDYVALAERANGPIPRSAPPDYVWGEAVAELDRAAPDVRIVNLETSVTTSPDWQPKGINYRMHPANVGCLAAAGLDCCVLANNHVLDWGRAGLAETLATLRGAGLATAGAGETAAEATAPAALAMPDTSRQARETAGPRGDSRETAGTPGRVLVFAWGSATSGIPRDWEAGPERPGVALLPDLSAATAGRIAAAVRRARRPGDLAVVSLHWGGNWGYEIPAEQRQFARALIDEGGADVVHGHSSHHPKGIEVHRGRPILYGCGDFLNDYEGIRGHEKYRSELVLAYLPALDPAGGRLLRFEMLPFRIRRFRLERAAPEEAAWLRETLDRECRPLGGGVELGGDGRLALRWG